jgi:lipoyl(octanoyl) transferase
LKNTRHWLLLESGLGDAAFNMALDESLLEAMSRLGRPVLRFYGWTERAASFGYFQKYADVERMTPLRPLVRRPTGGGLVPHDADWTYSLAVPPGAEWYLLTATESYCRVHEWIQAAFAKLGIETELAPCCNKPTEPLRRSRREEAHSQQPKTPNPKPEMNERLLTSSPTGQCFAGHEKFDLLWRGKKIAGAAQRRNRLGLLIQGSVQPPPLSLARTDWEKAMCEAGRVKFGIKWSNFKLDEMLRERAGLLAAQKYSQPDYNRRR